MKRRFKPLHDGELSSASRRRKNGTYLHKIKCCECGLRHLVQYELTKAGSLRFRAWRID